MTHDISKPKPKDAVSLFSLVDAKTAIIEGIVDGSVLNLNNAVEVSGADKGGQVEGLYKELKAESDMLSSVADASASEGKLIDDIIKDINDAATNFNGDDIKQMKVEVYSTVTLWKQAMIPDAE